MGNLDKRVEIRNLSKQRMRTLKFADAVTNICAGEQNTTRLCFFVRYKPDIHAAECTDKNGWFGDTNEDVIYSGHLSVSESNILFAPVWEAKYA